MGRVHSSLVIWHQARHIPEEFYEIIISMNTILTFDYHVSHLRGSFQSYFNTIYLFLYDFVGALSRAGSIHIMNHLGNRHSSTL
jgi:hypothetical protein